VSIENDSTVLREVVGEELHSVPFIVEMMAPLSDQADVVLLGEATHGTQEFYEVRCEITKRLIQDHGFNIIAVEADWPDAYAIHGFVQRGDQGDPSEVLGAFDRFPLWMWRNETIANFVGWLAHHNGRLHEAQRVGFFGLDLYSLFRSADSVICYLEGIDSEAAALARARYSCLEAVGRDVQGYGMAAASGLIDECEDRVLEQLREFQEGQASSKEGAGILSLDDRFSAEQNALVVKNAEQYYRALYRGDLNTWNLRDTHMFRTAKALLNHWNVRGVRPRMVVWAHNSHIGDASATEMREAGELNLGQLMREAFGHRSCRIGFTTYEGTVMAAREWGGDPEVRTVRTSMRGSYEDLFHRVERSQFFLALREDSAARHVLSLPRPERAIGVVYRPERESQSHYFHAQIADQFDGVIHIDRTSALKPLAGGRIEGAAA
jgi:erythromycin esterase-like protein